jgi:cytochrome c-type biogenesis protein CcsB
MDKILSLLYSTRLMAFLFIVFAAAMGVATFIENDYGTETAKALVYNAKWFELIMLLFAVNFFGNIFRFRLYRREKWVVLMFHLSFFLILVGAAVTRYISYEGIMPIQEGQVSNTFLTKDSYISVNVNDGKDQKIPNHRKILLSALGSNSYKYKTDFRGKDVEIRLTDYIPNAKQVFEASESGDRYLVLVESGSGGRHDHYIRENSVETVHGIPIGFNSDERAALDISSNEEGLLIRSAVDGSFFRMSDQFNGTVVKDSLQQLSLLSLYNVAGLQFVVPNMPVRGSYRTVSGDKDEHPMAQLEFEVRVDDQTKRVSLSGGEFMIQPPTQFSLNGLNFRLSYGAMQYELPFSLKLNDFQLETYPGSQSAMSYASEVTVIDPKETFDFRIYMNNILNYRGYKFFQSSYNITEEYEETHLSVNHDFWGTTLTYAGYVLLYTGLLMILFMKNTRFDALRKQLKKIEKKKAALTLALLLALTGLNAQDHNHVLSDAQIDSVLVANPVSLEHAAAFSQLVIQDAGGRMKPVHTYASQLLRKVSKHDTFRGLNATQAFLSILQDPQTWAQIPIVYIEKGNTQLRDILGMEHEEKYAAFSQFFEAGRYKLLTYQQAAQKKNVRSKFEKDVINVDRRINLLYSAIMGDILRIFPIPDDANNTWVSHGKLPSAAFKGQDSIFVRQLFPVYMQTLAEARQTGNYSDVDDILAGIKSFQKKYGAAVYPPERKIELEIAYNTYDVFRKLFSYYMYIGTLMFFLVIIRIFKPGKVIRFLIKASIAVVILLFLLHTGGLIARWIVSGHAPWSNAYESMIYVAWATMFFGLIFGRKSAMTIAATAFLTSFILMVAHWNWMDPEIANLVPVLDSYWLMIHVAIIVASYGPFALGMILGAIALLLMVLTTSKNKKRLSLMIREMTVINEMSITVGLVLLTIGNFLGGMWANESWGRYWGWDPKETWALISIMIYAFVLHVRLIPGLRGRFVFNMLSVAAFASILMTYFGVNFYLSGLHSYASGDKAITPTFVYYAVGVFTVLSLAAYVQFKKHYKK